MILFYIVEKSFKKRNFWCNFFRIITVHCKAASKHHQSYFEFFYFWFWYMMGWWKINDLLVYLHFRPCCLQKSEWERKILKLTPAQRVLRKVPIKKLRFIWFFYYFNELLLIFLKVQKYTVKYNELVYWLSILLMILYENYELHKDLFRQMITSWLEAYKK